MFNKEPKIIVSSIQEVTTDVVDGYTKVAGTITKT